MINYKSILAGEVRRRKYFKRKAKEYRRSWIHCSEEMKRLRRRVNELEHDKLYWIQNFEWEVNRRSDERVKEEKFKLEYDYCQKIDALEARLAIYETKDLSVSNDFDYNANAPMVLSAEQCKRLEEHLKKMRSISNKYKEVCRLMKSIDAVINE